jgi:hypothetical protein
MNAKAETTIQAPAVYAAIAAVMGDLAKTGISKDQTNTFDKYKFRGIDDVYNALAPLLAKHKLLILPRVLERHSEERTSKDNKAVFYITVVAEFDFVAAEDGSKHTVRAYGEAMDRGDKGTNKAMTAAYKYACFEAFCIPTEGADDADAETHEVTSNEAATVQEWIDCIDGATTNDALTALGADIAKAKLSSAAKVKVRAAFAARKHALQEAA